MVYTKGNPVIEPRNICSGAEIDKYSERLTLILKQAYKNECMVQAVLTLNFTPATIL
jgi:hypothetical protein